MKERERKIEKEERGGRARQRMTEQGVRAGEAKERERERGCRQARASNLVDMRVQTDWSVECEGTYPRVAGSVAVAEAR